MKITTAITYFQKNVHIDQLKNNHRNFFFRIIIVRFGDTEIAKEKFYVAKIAMKIWDVNIYNIAISKLIKTKTNCNYKYFIGTKSDKAIRPLALIMPKLSGYVKTFKVKDGDKVKSIN